MKQMIKTETEYVNRIRQELLRQMSKKEYPKIHMVEARSKITYVVACEGNLSKAKYGRMAMR